MRYRNNTIKERVCEDCGELYTHRYNIRFCPKCRSRRASEIRKKDAEKRGVYSFDNWEDCIIDEQRIREGIKCCHFLVENFRDTQQVKDLENKLVARLSRLIVDNENISDVSILMQTDVWEQKCEYFIENTLYEAFCSPGEDTPFAVEEKLYEKHKGMFQQFSPSPALCSHLCSHFKNHQRCSDPLKLMPLMSANLELLIIKEFKEQFKDQLYETD